MNIRVNGAWKEITSGKIFVDGAWKDIIRGQIRIGGAWKAMGNLVADLSLNAFPTSIYGSIFGAGIATSGITQATPTGGRGPYTYSWVKTSGLGTPTSPNTAAIAIQHTLSAGQEAIGTFRCTVTDSLGNTATATITSQLTSDIQGGVGGQEEF